METIYFYWELSKTLSTNELHEICWRRFLIILIKLPKFAILKLAQTVICIFMKSSDSRQLQKVLMENGQYLLLQWQENL